MQNRFMQRAIDLARKGVGMTSPNPCVGAVIVKGGVIVAEGWHKRAGSEHAEVLAIHQLMKLSGISTVEVDPTLFQNASLYVTLEPCIHQGKTGACAELIAKCGFQKVYVGMKDPFKKVNGKGLAYLRQNGISVEVLKKNSGLYDEVRFLNQFFVKWALTGMPYVIMKAGMSLDGKIATSSGESKWITGEKTREDARKGRSLCDAVMVGFKTVMADDPELAPVGKFRNKYLLRVVVDPDLRLPLNKKVFRDGNVVVFCCGKVSDKKLEKFEKAGIRVKKFPGDKISVKTGLKFLGKMGVQSLFVEGGSGVHGYMYDSELKSKGCVDKVLFYVAPRLIGGEKSLSVIGGNGVEKLMKSKKLSFVDVKEIDGDLKVEGIINYY